jgi:hypothetical protein
MKKAFFIASSTLLLFSCGTDCSQETGSYQDGYSNGKVASFSNSSISCDDWIYEMGWNESKATDCWCDGFYDGQSGEESKHPKD